ncbi:hypothetical protein DLNHIDIE_03151 [Acidithiobacillus thiooxidans ATCC 19377]|uniref:Uncharacterized protein n=1 Tax=Acidithiobacillus thiooxidans ATCC 19377 TaxID=637390 RepID=A0A543PZN7_ACITH|nr:hypothetical protein DLNHIDIE_03151 [Acidithiobacillus thiooxidans ATCC 19377]
MIPQYKRHVQHIMTSGLPLYGHGIHAHRSLAVCYFATALAEHYPPAAAALQHLEEKNT